MRGAAMDFVHQSQKISICLAICGYLVSGCLAQEDGIPDPDLCTGPGCDHPLPVPNTFTQALQIVNGCLEDQEAIDQKNAAFLKDQGLNFTPSNLSLNGSMILA
jgi:hypothetical protein